MPKRALIIDDDPAPAQVFLRFLSEMGWEANAVSTGKAALKIFKAGDYDVVICDVQLGDMSGIEVAKLLRLEEPSLRVIIASGCPDNFDPARDAGFTRFLQKPFDLSELRHALDSHRTADGPSEV